MNASDLILLHFKVLVRLIDKCQVDAENGGRALISRSDDTFIKRWIIIERFSSGWILSHMRFDKKRVNWLCH